MLNNYLTELLLFFSVKFYIRLIITLLEMRKFLIPMTGAQKHTDCQNYLGNTYFWHTTKFYYVYVTLISPYLQFYVE